MAKLAAHPGATLEQIQGEPHWEASQNRIGLKNRHNRRPGICGGEYEGHIDQDEESLVGEARTKFKALQDKAKKGELLNFRDIVQGLKDLRRDNADPHPEGWRFVLQSTEDWVKYDQDWPANVKRRQKAEQEQKEQDEKEKDDNGGSDTSEEEGDDSSKDADADADAEEQDDSSDQDTEAKEEKSLAQLLRDESEYIQSLENNNGQGSLPQFHDNYKDSTIDEQDQFTPDNWFPRSRHLVRTTGAHPLNAEPDLQTLFSAGLITPSELHYVRNHGHVPRLQWEFHKLEIVHHDNKLVHSMADLESKYKSVNLPVYIACDGNRRKELNMIKTSKGAPFGAGAGGCSYWKGPLLRDLLLAAGVPDPFGNDSTKNKLSKGNVVRWVNFEGSDELPEGPYATCITLEYAMDPTNDVMVAMEMNERPIPPDHGYPIRLVVPGFVGGRSVKWLRKIWTSAEENSSFYHIWDNRIPPNFVTSEQGQVADIMFHHPSTALYQQTLNSAITRPAQGETIPLNSDASRTYRVQGFAYNGDGRMIQRVELSLDGGNTWRYCVRKFPETPVRHNHKFWSWLFWHADVSMTDLLASREMLVRCFDVSNTQPEKPTWNMTGMMNNSWYRIKLEIQQRQDNSGTAELLCRHPTEPGPGKEGWMKPSYENQLETAKLDASSTSKQFTRDEIEKHDKEDDCWIVVGDKVYDATSVLSWHPGGGQVIMGHAGCVHPQTTTEFDSIHDSYAREKLQGESYRIYKIEYVLLHQVMY